MKKYIFLLLIIPIFSFSQSVLLVPSQYTSIQGAIDASIHGDTIIVSPGTYGSISLNGMNIYLTSLYFSTLDTNDISNTIIDGQNSGNVVRFDNGEDNTCTLNGFTVRNGNQTGSGAGGGIYINDASPSLSNLIIEDNQAEDGGGIGISSMIYNPSTGTVTSSIFRNLIIRNNISLDAGGGIWCHGPSQFELIESKIIGNEANSDGGGIWLNGNNTATIKNSLILGNYTNMGDGGGIWSVGSGVNLTIEESKITSNIADDNGGAIRCQNAIVDIVYTEISNNIAANDGSGNGGGISSASSQLNIQNVTITNNNCQNISAVENNGNASFNVKNSIIYANVGSTEISNFNSNDFSYSNVANIALGSNGNIDQDPLFTNPSNNDFSLQSNSPCINTGDPSAIYNDSNGSRNDMGAYPYDPCLNINSDSVTNVIACNSYNWFDSTYTQSGTHLYNISNRSSLVFDENQSDYIELNNSNGLDFYNKNQLTLSAWINADNFNGQKAVITSMSTIQNGNQAGHAQYALKIENQKMYFLSGHSNYGFEPNGPTLSKTVLDTNQWQHIAVTYNGTFLKFYLNGVLDTIHNIPNQTFPESSGNFYIGRYGPMNNLTNHYFDGEIDNVSIWDIALTETEIEQYMHCPPNGDENGLIGYWNFEEVNQSNTVIDLSSNNNFGITNGALYSTNVSNQSCNLKNVNGCDSSVILNLTISQADTSIINRVACDSYTWNDSTYTQSGTYYSNTFANNNYSISFDGINDYVQIPNPSGYFTDKITVACDLNANFSQITNNGYKFLNKYYTASTNGRSFGLSINQENGLLYIKFSILNGDPGPYPSCIYKFQYNFNSNEWYNITATYNKASAAGDRINIFVNGQQLYNPIIIEDNSIDIGNNNTPLEIGRHFDDEHNYQNGFLNGSIDNIHIWDNILSPQDILNYMNCPPTGNESSLVGYWNFEDNSDTILDLTLNGNDGIINGANYSTNIPTQSCNLTNINGCDSTVSLELTINNSNSDTILITTCDSYSWKDSTYLQSGIYSSNIGSVNNYALSFDGDNDYVLVNGLSGTFTTLSFVTKVKINADNYNQQIFYFGQESTGNSSTGSIDLTIDDINYSPTALRINLNYAHGSIEYQSIVLNSWIDVAGVFDGINQMLYMYIDGQLIDSTSTTVNKIMFSNSDPHKIGAGTNSNHSVINFFNGDISNLAFFDYKLSNQEIQNFKTCPPSGIESGMIGCWNFEEGNGDTAIDLSVNENNGVINGATYETNVPIQSCNLINVNGCDSLTVLNLTINQSDTSFTYVSACDSFQWGENTFYQSGIYLNNQITNATGLVGFSYIGTHEGSHYYISQNHEVWTNADSICSALGGSLLCISDTAENNFISSFINEYVWIGLNDEQNEGTFVWTNGDSLVYTNWLPTQPDNYTDAGSPNGQDYAFMNNLNGMWEDDNEIFSRNYILELPSTSNLLNSVGCDSVAILNLTINKSDTSHSNITVCDNYTWNGTTYVSSGTYTFIDTNIVGCDSVAILNLTINNSSSSSTNVTACDNYTWNGATYDSSGTYSYSGGNPSNMSGFTYGGSYNGSKYYLSNSPSSWSEADSICNANGGYLVTISDSLENNFVYTFSSNHYIWIGLYQNTSSPTFSEPTGGWEWVTGESLNYINWDSNEPNNGGALNIENNAIMFSYTANNPGSWADANDTNDTDYTIDGKNIYFVMEIPETLTNINGCDSTAVLNLTILNSSTVPNIACYETAIFDTITCAWIVTGIQPTQPVQVNCWDVFTFNTVTCSWDTSGTQPVQPSLACYESATFNTVTCSWDVTGTPLLAEIKQLGETLSAFTNPPGLNADWYNIQTENGNTRIWLMQEDASFFSPKFDCSYFIVVNYEECVDTSEIYNFSANDSRIGSFLTSPNPTKGLVNVKFQNTNNQIVTFNLIGNNGVKIDEFITLENNLNIDLSKYPSGTYYLYFNSEEAIQGCRLEEPQKISTKIILNK